MLVVVAAAWDCLFGMEWAADRPCDDCECGWDNKVWFSVRLLVLVSPFMAEEDEDEEDEEEDE